MTTFLQTLLLGILGGSVYGLFSAGLSLAFGVLRLVNFAHGDFVMLGMFAAYAVFTLLHVPIYVAIPIAIVGGAIISVPVYFIFFKGVAQKTVHGQLVIALGLSLLVENVVLEHRQLRSPGRSTRFPLQPGMLGDFSSPSRRPMPSSQRVVATVMLELLLQRTAAGRVLRAVVADREAARG